MANRKRPPGSTSPPLSSHELQPDSGRPSEAPQPDPQSRTTAPEVAFFQQNHLQIFQRSLSASDLQAYEQIVPGSAERLLKMQETELRLLEMQVANRIELEQTVIKGDNKRANWGLATGFLIALAGIGTSGFLIMNGHDVAGSVLGGTTFVSLVGTFIYGTNSRKEERRDKTEIMAQHQSQMKNRKQ